ncbi:type II toxin-antitoxin system ParD family antitoxin [Caballeronia cordobensis]|uniref:type II toxin-antitoxin system ParD family antitoxin n=1 Tax=Caballeronia cordobensis TaxID=1353886 RepID=UPI00045EE321|nr:putative addiction module antidote protein, CopG/Arc/MetJ family [Burkholderia sp. RPE67]
MPKNTSVSLGDHFADFVEDRVRTGRYSTASDVVRAGLRLLEEQEAKLGALRSALEAGERSGPSKALDFDAFIARKRKSA